MTAIRELLFTFVGPGRLWIVARVGIDDGLRGAQVKALARGIESGLKHESGSVYRVDVVTIGRETMREPAAAGTKVEDVRRRFPRVGKRKTLKVHEAFPPDAPLHGVRIVGSDRWQLHVVVGRRGPVSPRR